MDGDVDLVFNTTEGWQSLKDSHSIRTTALNRKVPYFTTAAASLAAARSIEAVRGHALEVASLQSYYSASGRLSFHTQFAPFARHMAAPGQGFEKGLNMASADKVPMLQEGFAQLTEELKRLRIEERPAIVEAIEAARAHGDLSENAEYHAAKERQGHVEATIADLEDRLSRAMVIDPTTLSGDKVLFGATVTLVDEEEKGEISAGRSDRGRRQGRADQLQFSAGPCVDRAPDRRRGRGFCSLGRPLLRDQEDRVRLSPNRWSASLATATVAITAVTVAGLAGTAALGLDQQAALAMGFIPARLSGVPLPGPAVPAFLTPLTATLVHSGLLHLASTC